MSNPAYLKRFCEIKVPHYFCYQLWMHVREALEMIIKKMIHQKDIKAEINPTPTPVKQ